MPYSSAGTDSQSLSCGIKDCMDYFYMPTKIVALTSDCGGNLSTCKKALDHVVDNSDVFNPKQHIFEQLCNAHI